VSRTSETRVREVKNASYGILMSVRLKHLFERYDNSILLNIVYSELISFRQFCVLLLSKVQKAAMKLNKLIPGFHLALVPRLAGMTGKGLFLYKFFHKFLCSIFHIFKMNHAIDDISRNTKSSCLFVSTAAKSMGNLIDVHSIISCTQRSFDYIFFWEENARNVDIF
jgi:hypothetical protein